MGLSKAEAKRGDRPWLRNSEAMEIVANTAAVVLVTGRYKYTKGCVYINLSHDRHVIFAVFQVVTCKGKFCCFFLAHDLGQVGCRPNAPHLYYTTAKSKKRNIINLIKQLYCNAITMTSTYCTYKYMYCRLLIILS